MHFLWRSTKARNGPLAFSRRPMLGALSESKAGWRSSQLDSSRSRRFKAVRSHVWPSVVGMQDVELLTKAENLICEVEVRFRQDSVLICCAETSSVGRLRTVPTVWAYWACRSLPANRRRGVVMRTSPSWKHSTRRLRCRMSDITRIRAHSIMHERFFG